MSLLPQKSTFDRYVQLGLLNSQTDGDRLTIYNYSQFTTYERLWNTVTRAARGLVLDDAGRVVVRCLPKFFNDDEPEADLGRPKVMNPDDIVVQDKVDGSLIQVVDDNEYGLVVTSKGSFASDQALWAREIIIDEGFEFASGWTYIFELIHPDNRIVIDYGDRRELVLLAVVETATGCELDIYNERFDGFTRADRLDPSTLEDLARLGDDRLVEGVVANYAGHRVKIKTDEYVRLHRIVTNFTPKRVWEALSSGDSLEFENMPEEFQAWLDETVEKFQDEFEAIRSEIDIEFDRTAHLTDKELGLSNDYRYKSQIFTLRRGKDVTPAVWKLVKECPCMAGVSN